MFVSVHKFVPPNSDFEVNVFGLPITFNFAASSSNVCAGVGCDPETHFSCFQGWFLLGCCSSHPSHQQQTGEILPVSNLQRRCWRYTEKHREPDLCLYMPNGAASPSKKWRLLCKNLQFFHSRTFSCVLELLSSEGMVNNCTFVNSH